MATGVTLTIGGLTLTVSGGDSVAKALALPGMGAFRGETNGNDVHLRLDERVELPECRWLHRFDIMEETAECRFGVDASGIYYYTFGDSGLLRFDPRTPGTVSLNTIDDPNILRFALWTAYSMAGLWRDAVPVHSSVVVCRGRAVMCLGESGTGKSTHTALWMKHIDGCHLLNDDSPILRVEDDGVFVYGSPWSGKTPCYRQERVPVAALLRLEQRPENKIRRLGTIESFTALHPSCPPALAHDELCTDRMVDFIGGVISRVPVYSLGCLPDEGAARLAFNTLMA
jgi:hypothetical protein